MQFDKVHAVTVVATALLASNRFVAYEGKYPSAGGGAKDAQGVSEFAAEKGEAVSVVTSYSYPVLAAGTIQFGDPVKSDAEGRAIAATTGEHCGIALGAATAGQLVEVQICKHVHV